MYEKKKEINLPEIRKVLAHIEGDMRRLEMRKWGVTKEYVDKEIPSIKAKLEIATDAAFTADTDTYTKYLVMLKQMNETGWADCNARACFAGWQVLLSTPKEEWYKLMGPDYEISGVREQARMAFGFTADESYDVFMPAYAGETAEEQLKILKKNINRVLAHREMAERV